MKLTRVKSPADKERITPMRFFDVFSRIGEMPNDQTMIQIPCSRDARHTRSGLLFQAIEP
jgi:hypothetical protein